MATATRAKRDDRLSLEQLEAKFKKGLIKQPRTLKEIGDKVGVPHKALCRVVGSVVRSGDAEVHKGRPPKYSKPSGK